MSDIDYVRSRIHEVSFVVELFAQSVCIPNLEGKYDSVSGSGPIFIYGQQKADSLGYA